MTGRVLIVDDAPFLREELAKILTSSGLDVVGMAEDGPEALDAYRRIEPDLVTLDLVMPHAGGVEVTRAIRAVDPAARILVSATYGQEVMVMEALAAGASDCLVRPFREASVLATLRRLFERRPISVDD